jgi:hypothetical protein
VNHRVKRLLLWAKSVRIASSQLTPPCYFTVAMVIDQRNVSLCVANADCFLWFILLCREFSFPNVGVGRSEPPFCNPERQKTEGNILYLWLFP